MFRSLMVILALACASLVQAQTVPGPRATIAFDQPMSPSCESTIPSNAWGFTYGTCYLPATVVLGSPFLTHVKVTFVGATTISTVIPRAQVTQETTAARCGGGPAPCLRINDIPAPVGASQLRVSLVDGEGREGAASTAIPFTGSSPAVPAAGGLRLITTP